MNTCLPRSSTRAAHARTCVGRMRPGQRGVATLIVVMVLFFVMSLVAAYASRNIIFEQRTAANQYTNTVSLEAANAGLDWAMGLINGSRIDDNCSPSTSPTNASFRQRYVQIDPSTGTIAVPTNVRDGPSWPTCWFNRATNDWVCHCPGTAGGTIASTPTDPFTPSFRVRFVQLDDAFSAVSAVTAPKGIVAIEVNGCTSWNSACLDFPSPPKVKNRCQGTVCAQLALASGLKSPFSPPGAITARGSVDFAGAAVAAANGNPSAGCGLTREGSNPGHAVVAGGSVNQTGMTLRSPPGQTKTVIDFDSGLSDPLFTAERMFAGVFGSWPATYIEQPGAVRVNCSGTCDSAAVRSVIEANPGRVLVLQGDVVLNGGASIGTATDPVVLMTTGNFGFSSPTEVFGFVYSRAANWNTTGSGTITGAMVAEGNIGGNGAYTVTCDSDILERLRRSTGSFVMVPGSWRDYP